MAQAQQTITLFRPLPYQVPIVAALTGDNGYKYVTACLSRRIGKSLTAKNVLLYWALREQCNIGYVVPTGVLARKFLREIVSVLSCTGLVATSNTTDMFIKLTNGSMISFLSAQAADGNRGVGYKYLIYDEAAFIIESTYLSVFKAMELEAAKVFYISTPCGGSGFFYTAFKKGQDKKKYPQYISFRTTLEEANLYDPLTIQDIKDSTPTAIYRQEYMCEFLSGGISCFGDISRFLSAKPFAPTRRLFAGIDFSSTGTDETVLTIVNEGCEMVAQYTYKIGNSQSIDDMAKKLNEWKVCYCLAETNSMGSLSIDYLKKKYHNIEGITTTNSSKREYVENVIYNFQNNIGGLINDAITVQEFNQFVMKYTSTKKVTYTAISDSLHDDRVISYCLACWACSKKNRRGKYNINF